MDYAVGGVALGEWQLIDLGLMGAIGLELIGLIFLKVVVILLGALLYATGPVTIGLVPTRAGSALARAWASAGLALLLLGIAWATLFADGALLIGDAGSAGPLIAGNSALGSLAGGLLLAVAGLASLWPCLKVAREMAALLRLQLSGLLGLGGQRGTSGTTSAASLRRTSGQSVREFGSRLARAAGAAGGELALAGAGSGALSRAGRAAGSVGRRGLDRSGGSRGPNRCGGGCADGWSGIRSLPPGCRCGAHGARRDRKLAGKTNQPRREATRTAHRGRGCTGRQRDSPGRNPRTAGTSLHNEKRADQCRRAQFGEQELGRAPIGSQPRQQPAQQGRRLAHFRGPGAHRRTMRYLAGLGRAAPTSPSAIRNAGRQ